MSRRPTWIVRAIEILDLVRHLGRTVGMVLHDLNLAVRYSDHIVVLDNGRIAASGKPVEVITPGPLRDAFDLEGVVIDDPVTGGLLIVPRAPRVPGC